MRPRISKRFNGASSSVDTGAKFPRSAGFVGGCARPRSHSGRDESDDDFDVDVDVDGPVVAVALRISIAILSSLRDAQ